MNEVRSQIIRVTISEKRALEILRSNGFEGPLILPALGMAMQSTAPGTAEELLKAAEEQVYKIIRPEGELGE